MVIHFGELPAWRSVVGGGVRFRLPDVDAVAGESIQTWKWSHNGCGFFEMQFEDTTTFVLSEFADEVWAWWPDPLTLEDAATYLCGPVLGTLLRLRGWQCLHAGAFVMNGTAVAVVGESGAGKSTTMAALALRGISIITDDIVAFRRQDSAFVVSPTLPQLKLWPDSAATLFGDASALELISPTHPTWDKRAVNLLDERFTYESSPVPLAAIYLLRERVDSQSAPTVGNLRPREALDALLANLQAVRLLDASARRRAFMDLSELVTHIPVREIVPRTDLRRLDDLCDLLVTDCTSLLTSAHG